MSLCQAKHHGSGTLYPAFAFGSVLLAAFGSFFAKQAYYAPAGWVVFAFAAGGIYGALGILSSGAGHAGRPWRRGWYYPIQLVLLTAILFRSPSRGFLAIVVLPLVSQAIFDLRPRWATAVAIYLFAISVGVWAIPYGWAGVSQAAMGLSTAFIFTIAFTLITKQALVAREREQRLREEVEQANRQLRDYAAQAEELATTRERNRVAREIHDGVGHYLTVVKTQLDAATALLPAQPERAREAVQKAARLSAEALDDVRRSVGSLRTDVRRPPLPDAVRALAQELGVPVAVTVTGEPRALPPAIEHALFRSAQEALTNVQKHAGASAAELVLDYSRPGRVRLAVKDNGRGAPAPGAAVTGGYGLRGIRERVELLGGAVASGNRVDGGFALTIEVPA